MEGSFGVHAAVVIRAVRVHGSKLGCRAHQGLSFGVPFLCIGWKPTEIYWDFCVYAWDGWMVERMRGRVIPHSLGHLFTPISVNYFSFQYRWHSRRSWWNWSYLIRSNWCTYTHELGFLPTYKRDLTGLFILNLTETSRKKQLLIQSVSPF